MADVSGARNFWGRLVDGILPGSQYNRQTGQFSNIGSGIAGFVGNQFAPGLGTLFARGWERRGNPMGGLFQNNTGAINQMANPQGHGYDFQPWGGVGLPGMGQNPFGVNYHPPAPGFNGNSGGGARGAFTFGGYQSPEHREQSIAATQDSLRMAAARTPNSRQMHNYVA